MEDLWICVALFGHWSPTLVIIFTEVYDVFFYFVQLKTNIPGLLILVFHSDKYWRNSWGLHITGIILNSFNAHSMFLPDTLLSACYNFAKLQWFNLKFRVLKFCLRLQVFSIPNQNGSAVPENGIEGQYFVIFLANILIVRLIFLRILASSG